MADIAFHILMAALMIGSISCVRKESSRPGPDMAVRREFIAKAIASLRSIKPTGPIRPPEAALRIYKDGGSHVSIPRTLKEDESHVFIVEPHPFPPALIPVGKTGWVCATCSSSHGNRLVGDVILAIDHTGQLYTCEGHLCGSLRLKSAQANGFKTLDEFMRSLESTAGPWAKLAP